MPNEHLPPRILPKTPERSFIALLNHAHFSTDGMALMNMIVAYADDPSSSRRLSDLQNFMRGLQVKLRQRDEGRVIAQQMPDDLKSLGSNDGMQCMANRAARLRSDCVRLIQQYDVPPPPPSLPDVSPPTVAEPATQRRRKRDSASDAPSAN